MCKNCTPTQQQSVPEVLFHLQTHVLPKIDKNLVDLGIAPIATAAYKTRGKYTEIVLIGHYGQRIGVGIAARAPSDIADPSLGLKLAFERAVQDYIHDEPTRY